MKHNTIYLGIGSLDILLKSIGDKEQVISHAMYKKNLLEVIKVFVIIK